MAAHWDISDAMLQRMLQAYMDFLAADGQWRTIHLYQNAYTPIPGSDETDYIECDFPGYAPMDQLDLDWGSVTVALHVASSTSTTPLEFVADSTGFSTQAVYGYYMIHKDGSYLGGERFADMRTMHPDDILKVTPILRHATFPNP